MSQTILIADDDRDHLLMLAFMLRKAGYRIISAFDAKHALQMAVEHAPDLLLLDIHLGEEDGFAIQQRLAGLEEMADTPVIYVTGDTSASVKAMSLALGAQAILIKPFKWEELLGAVAEALQSPDPADPSPTHVPALQCAEAYIG